MENEIKTKKRLREKSNYEICKENGIEGIILTNIVDESITKKRIRAVLQIIAKALSSTLGPDGSTTILQDTQKQHLVTKDGLDVITRMSFEDEISRTVLDMVKNISLNQVLKVGDGSTSAIIVANALYQELTDESNADKFKYASPKIIVEILNYLSEYLEKALKQNARKVSDNLAEISNIAAVAMNNDKTVGDMMREIYLKIGKYGFITTDITENYEEDYVEYKRGISWNRGYIEPVFAENYSGRRIIHKKPAIFITTTPITADDIEALYTPLLKSICLRDGRELVIIGNFINDEARNFFCNARESYKLSSKANEMLFTVVDIDQVTETSKNKLKDLSYLCGCEIFNKGKTGYGDVTARLDDSYTRDDKYKFIGNALKATIVKGSTEIICDDALLSEAEIQRKLDLIDKINSDLAEYEKMSNPTADDTNTQYDLKLRKSNLENTTAILHVGGKTYQERSTRERLLEDAIFAAKSTLNYGYVVGGNIMIPRILEKDSDFLAELLKKEFGFVNQDIDFFKYFINLVKTSFLESYEAVLDNSKLLTDEVIESILNNVIHTDMFYNLKTHKYESFLNTSVINSVDTDIQIMKSCISLIGLLATSNQIITLNYNVRDQVKK